MPLYIKVIGTGSKGNTYILSGLHNETLILDAGEPTKKVLPHIPNIHRIEGCLVTHEHQDHSRALKDYYIRGIRCITSKGTWDALGINNDCGVKPMEPIKTYSYTIMPFDVQHDAAEPLGFLIRYNVTGETLVYATDTYYLKYTFPGVNYWLIECNYCDDLIDGETDVALRNRLKESHMSLKRLKDVFKANDMRDAGKIILCHLSDKRSDEKRMVQEIRELTCVETVAANAGMLIECSLTPF